MKKTEMECIALVSVHTEVDNISKLEHLEKRQEICIRNYAKSKGIKIVGVICTRGLGQMYINQKFNEIVWLIQNKKVQGLIVLDMFAISSGLADAYLKVGKVRSVGGTMITVNDGLLRLNMRRYHGKESI